MRWTRNSREHLLFTPIWFCLADTQKNCLSGMITPWIWACKLATWVRLPEDPILKKINPWIEKKCCSIILKMVQFRALKFNIVINPDIGLILIWYWWWYWSDIDLDIDLILIWYWSGIDLILIWYWSDIDLYWSWYCMIFHLVLANTGETKVKPRWNCFPVNLWLSLKPSNLFRVA